MNNKMVECLESILQCYDDEDFYRCSIRLNNGEILKNSNHSDPDIDLDDYMNFVVISNNQNLEIVLKSIPAILEGDLILVDMGYYQQVETVSDDGEIYTCDSYYSYDKEYINENLLSILRSNEDKGFSLVYDRSVE